MSVCCECCVLSDRCLCDGPIPFPEESCGCLSVVCCQVEVCATGRSLFQRSPVDVCRECCELSGRGFINLRVLSVSSGDESRLAPGSTLTL